MRRLNDRQEPHLTTTVRADEWIGFMNFFDQSRLSTSCSLAELGIFFVSFLRKMVASPLSLPLPNASVGHSYSIVNEHEKSFIFNAVIVGV